MDVLYGCNGTCVLYVVLVEWLAALSWWADF